VRIFDCAEAVGRGITRYDSDGATYAGLVTISGEGALGMVRLAAQGRLGRHPAILRQLALVIDGSGAVSGVGGRPVALAAGSGVLWEPGEEHQTTTETGMTLLILEAEHLELTQTAASEH
jgi:quercetin dioxygenase-like cupin family protein